MIKNVILSTLAIAVLAGCSGKKDSDKDTSVVEAIPVKVQKLEKENIARTLDYTANLQADEQVYYAPAATGRIEKISGFPYSFAGCYPHLQQHLQHVAEMVRKLG